MKNLLNVFEKKNQRIPIWFMRQAGRYLPEYKEIRIQNNIFLDMCLNTSIIHDVTLMPLRRFDLDAAIIFTDILVIPYALGQNVSFSEQKGPLLGDFKFLLDSFDISRFHEKLMPIYEGIKRVRHSLEDQFPHAALIGFSAAPWTLCAYMLEGSGSKDFAHVKRFLNERNDDFNYIFFNLVELIIDYLKMQIQMGAEFIQIFDTWAGLLDYSRLQMYSVEALRRIVKSIKKDYPSVPIVIFPKGVGLNYVDYTFADGLSVDSSFSFRNFFNLKRENDVVLQGNLDPFYLFASENVCFSEVSRIFSEVKLDSFIFNLGHGIFKETSVDRVKCLIEFCRGQNF